MKQQSVVRISLIVFIAVAVGIGFLSVPQAFAERGACREDVAKFCKDVPPGQGNIMKCLKEHENELSPACKEHQARMGNRRHEGQGECKADADRLCGNVKPGEGRMMQCLKEHENELSPQCKARMQSRQQRKAE